MSCAERWIGTAAGFLAAGRCIKATLIPAETPLFILQGGIDRSKLKGLNMLLISMLTRGLASNKKRSKSASQKRSRCLDHR